MIPRPDVLPCGNYMMTINLYIDRSVYADLDILLAEQCVGIDSAMIQPCGEVPLIRHPVAKNEIQMVKKPGTAIKALR
jgi:hypothetical protein